MVLKIIAKELTVSAAAERFGLSRRHIHRLLARYRDNGLGAVDPRPRRPHSNPTSTTQLVRERVVELRRELTAQGLDAGPLTIAWHLENEGHRPPSTSTIRRILHTASLITPEPRKRPRSSYIRFQAAQPNETWQSDFTHWRLADGTDVEILNWLDDHSRYFLGCTAASRVTGDLVVSDFLRVTDRHGIPASTLTDNGSVFTSRFTGGKNAFEYVLALQGVRQKNGSASHPQTQRKIERFHQTLKRWLAKQPPADTIRDLQRQLDRFRDHYNERRPHRANDRATPAAAYRATVKAAPATTTAETHYRVRYDHVADDGKVSLRRAGRMHHLGISVEHRRKRILALIDDTTVTVVHLDTGEIIARNTIDPTRSYWRNTMKAPGRWPNR